MKTTNHKENTMNAEKKTMTDAEMREELAFYIRTAKKFYDDAQAKFLADAKIINPHVRTIGLTATPFRMSSGSIARGAGGSPSGGVKYSTNCRKSAA